MTGPVVTGYGANDSHALVLHDGRPNPHPSAGKPYGTITGDALFQMVQTPPTVAKELGQWIIPSSYAQHDARSHDAQRAHGQFQYLAGDVDKGNPSLQEVRDAVATVLGQCAFVVFSTRSATPSYRKWRVLVPLAGSLSGAQYGAFQAALFDGLEYSGLTMDRTLERAAQLVYLPNRGQHYEWDFHAGPMLDALGHPMAGRAKQYMEVHEAAQQRLTGQARTEGHRSPLRAFRNKHSIEDLLALYGYERKGVTDHWRSPNSDSGSYSTQDRGDHWISLSHNDAALGIGKATANGSRYGDAFDLYTHYSCNGNAEQAMLYARQCLQEEDDTRYGEATAGCMFRPDHNDPLTGEFVAAGLHPSPDRQPGNGWDIWHSLKQHTEQANERRMQADKQAAEEAAQFSDMAAKAERAKWGGPWLKDVPFDVEPNALEWAAWHAPGALGMAIRAKAHQTTRRSLVPLLAGALAALCHLGQGKVVLRFKHFITPSTLMMFLVGGTGSGKGDAAAMFYDIVHAVKPELSNQVMSKVMRNFASGEAVTQFLADVCPNVVLLQNEAGAARAANRGNGRQESVAAELTDIFTAFTTGIEGTHAKTAGLSVSAVANPSIAALLLSTPDKLFKTIEGGDAESGWLGRYLFLPLKQSAKVEHTAEFANYPPALLTYVNRLAALTPPQMTLGDRRVYNGRERCFHVLRYSADAEEYMKEIDRTYDKRVIDPRYSKLEQALYSRAQEAVSRLSFVAGLACSVDAEVQLHACQWADVVVKASLDYVTSRMENVYEGDEDDSPTSRVRKTVRTYFQRAASDAAFARGFGLNCRVNVDGQVELARSQLKVRMYQNALKAVRISAKQVNEEIEEMIKDGELVDLGLDLNRRQWLRVLQYN